MVVNNEPLTLMRELNDSINSLLDECGSLEKKANEYKALYKVTDNNGNHFNHIINNKTSASKLLLLSIKGDVDQALQGNKESLDYLLQEDLTDDFNKIKKNMDVLSTYLSLLDKYPPFREVETNPGNAVNERHEAYFPDVESVGNGNDAITNYVYVSEKRLEEMVKSLNEQFPGDKV